MQRRNLLMMKKWLLWLAVMLAALLCAAAAEPAYEITGTNRVFFPEYNGMTATFRNAETWAFVTHPRNTTRVETYTVNVSSIRTKLTFTDVPTGVCAAGQAARGG